jgi:hypothetical protein
MTMRGTPLWYTWQHPNDFDNPQYTLCVRTQAHEEYINYQYTYTIKRNNI